MALGVLSSSECDELDSSRSKECCAVKAHTLARLSLMDCGVSSKLILQIASSKHTLLYCFSYQPSSARVWYANPVSYLIQTFSNRTLFFGFFLQIEESGSPQILILQIAESSVVHKILLKLFQRIPLTFCGKF